jgi:hypothetical protein
MANSRSLVLFVHVRITAELNSIIHKSMFCVKCVLLCADLNRLLMELRRSKTKEIRRYFKNWRGRDVIQSLLTVIIYTCDARTLKSASLGPSNYHDIFNHKWSVSKIDQ